MLLICLFVELKGHVLCFERQKRSKDECVRDWTKWGEGNYKVNRHSL